MKKFVQRWLAGLARNIIAKHKPKVIGITGSVGKTSTRDAIYAVVSTAFSVRKGEKNFNNEFGLPFAILGVDSPGRNPIKWLWVFLKGYLILWTGILPEVLVLEMGVDKPGDMDFLVNIARPDIAVLTNIGISHYEFFQTTEAVATEKSKILTALSSTGVAILNGDHPIVLEQKNKLSASGPKVITYGTGSTNDIQLNITNEHFAIPVSSTISVHTAVNDFEVTIPVIGTAHSYAVGAAIAVGLNLNISTERIQKGLKNYSAPAGRLNFMKGIKQTVIIDDSYNASPDSVSNALQVVMHMPQTAKMIVLGDMLELGDLSEQSHLEIGYEIAKLNPAKLIAVGNEAKSIIQGAVDHGYDTNNTKWFVNSDEAKEWLRDNLITESVVLVKGSQGVRMEKISKELLLEPASASQILPRQYGKWLE